MQIKVDDLRGSAIASLLRAHLQNLSALSPPESMHALDLEALRRPEITFWSVWENNDLLGCGALRELDKTHGEIKSMRTVSTHLRKGVASTLLNHMIYEARCRNYSRLSLETGASEPFIAARNLYAKFGFKPCCPFADYIHDPNSAFMTLQL
jgi:putative acetyltransferase